MPGCRAVQPCAQPRPPGTEFLDAETKRQKSSFKRANARRDQNPGTEWPEIPAETRYSASCRKRAVCGDWMVVEAVLCEPVSIKFPAKQGKNREIPSFFSGSLGFRRSLRPKFKHLLPISLSFGAGKCMAPNREFFCAIRECGKATIGVSRLHSRPDQMMSGSGRSLNSDRRDRTVSFYKNSAAIVIRGC